MEIEFWGSFLLIFAAISLVVALGVRVWCSLHWSVQNKIKEKATMYGVFILFISVAAYLIVYTINWNITH